MSVYYGLISKAQALATAKAVCNVLGEGGGHAVELLLETAAAETLVGTYKDPTVYGAGAGLCQVDEGTFKWLRDTYKVRRQSAALRDAFGIDLNRVSYQELDFSPLLSMVFCRLRYLIVPTPIPVDRHGRADYWKRWYNSSAGAGTPEEYLRRCDMAGVDELLIGQPVSPC